MPDTPGRPERRRWRARAPQGTGRPRAQRAQPAPPAPARAQSAPPRASAPPGCAPRYAPRLHAVAAGGPAVAARRVSAAARLPGRCLDAQPCCKFCLQWTSSRAALQGGEGLPQALTSLQLGRCRRLRSLTRCSQAAMNCTTRFAGLVSSMPSLFSSACVLCSCTVGNSTSALAEPAVATGAEAVPSAARACHTPARSESLVQGRPAAAAAAQVYGWLWLEAHCA